jgi:hypothetical protein
VCGVTTHGESKHTLPCSVVIYTAYIYIYKICACAVLKQGKNGRRQERKNEEGKTQEWKENKTAIYIQRPSDEAKTDLPKSNL